MSSYSELDRPVQFLKGVGPKRAELLGKLGLLTARDLLYHVPRRYEDASTVQPIGSLGAGMEATVVGRVVSKGVLPTRKGLRIFQAVVQDASGLIECSWPGQPFLDRQDPQGRPAPPARARALLPRPQLQPREFTVLAREGEERGARRARSSPSTPPPRGSRSGRSAS